MVTSTIQRVKPTRKILWSDGSVLLLGEVSMVNDDHKDNFFLEEQGRFPAIEEDENPSICWWEIMTDTGFRLL